MRYKVVPRLCREEIGVTARDACVQGWGLAGVGVCCGGCVEAVHL